MKEDDTSLLVRKLLDSTPDRFIQIVASIEQTNDLDDITLDEIVLKPKALEERIKLRKEGQVESQENLLFAHSEYPGKGRRFSKRGGQIQLGKYATVDASIWYLHNGASNHMTGTKSHFRDIDESVTGRVHFGDGSYVQIKGRGSILLDDCTRFMWAYFLTSKDQAFSTFKEFRQQIEMEMRMKLRMLRIDRGGEFTSNEFTKYCKENGIARQLIAPYSPQQNRVVERRNRIVISTTRSMMKAMKLTLTFWAEAVKHAIYILNREHEPITDLDSPITPPTYTYNPNSEEEEEEATICSLMNLENRFDDTPVRGFKDLTEIYQNAREVETETLLFTEKEPWNYKEALKDEKWIEAMEIELDSINRNNTWTLTTLPTN
nr:zinc finger, CCHC-type [Tanacetum cinerariifolium]